jgi:uncharacterized protein (DUF2062 family)
MPASNILLVNLAIADTLLLLHTPIKIDEIISHEFRLGTFLCKSSNSAKTLFMVESVVLITILAFDRYWSIKNVRANIGDSKMIYKW